MFKTFVTAVALGAALSASTTAGPGLEPGGAGAASPFTFAGTSQGDWDLPSADGSAGFATGVLTIGPGFPFYLWTVTLPSDTVQTVGDRVVGTLSGTLLSFPLPPGGQGGLDVSGSWSVDANGEGGFTAFFTQQASPGGPILLLGAMKGSFTDLELPGGPDLLGSYEAVWGVPTQG